MNDPAATLRLDHGVFPAALDKIKDNLPLVRACSALVQFRLRIIEALKIMLKDTPSYSLSNL